LTYFFDMNAVMGHRMARQRERLSHTLYRLCEARSETATLPTGGGSADAQARTPRRSPGTAKAKQTDGGDEDGDGGAKPLRPFVKLYRVADAMEQLSVSRATLYRLVAAGKLRLVKIGGASRITAESIDALIAGGPPH
jgi:excisionase family DNA binding protein